MDFRKKFVVEPGTKVKLSKIDAAYKGNDLTKEQALETAQKDCHRISKQQYFLYSEKNILFSLCCRPSTPPARTGPLTT
jgi:hypothetical protein